MATIALQAAGTAAFGPVGGIIGAAVGSYIDQEYIMPALFPQDPIQGPRIGELQLQGQDEGYPMNSCYAQFTRVGACLIWTSKLRETKSTEEVGGKGGGEEIENYTYSIDLALAFSDAPTAFEAIEKIYADVGLIYDFTPNVNYSSDQLSCTVIDIYEEVPTIINKVLESLSVLVRKELRIASTTTGPDLGLLRSGRNAVIAGWTESSYNLTAQCNASWTNDSGTSVAKFELPLAASSAGEAAGNTITLDQTNPPFDTSKMDAVTVHLGGPTQSVDSFLEGVLGVGETPAFRDQCWVMIQNFQLSDYGNRVPQFQAELNRGTADELDDVFSDILNDSDMLPAEYDVTALVGVAVKGYATRGPQPILGRLQPLMVTFDILGRESNGVLTFFRRLNTVDITVDANDLTAQPEGERSAPVPHELDETDDTDSPAEVLVKYIDDENDLQPGEQLERNPIAQSKYEKRTAELTVTLNGGEARDVAAKVMWSAVSGRRLANLQLPISYATIQENDVLEYTYLGEPHRYRVQELNDGENGVKQIIAQREVTANVTHNSPHEVPLNNSGTFMYSPYNVTLSIIDIAPLTGAHVNIPVLYFAARSDQNAASWKGSTLQHSSDAGVTYSTLASLNTQASMGRTTTNLGAGTGAAQWDRGSTLVVEMNTGTLSTVTELDCLNGSNRAAIGGEIIGFVTATLSASQPDADEGISYDLTNLLRGLSGTERNMAGHNTGDRFVHLNAVGVETIDQNLSAVGSTREYVATAPGADPTDSVARTWIYAANNMRDFHPVLETGERGVPATNDWTVEFTRRSRAFFRVLSQVCPLLEALEDYEVDIYDVTETTVLRIITSTVSANGSVVVIIADQPQFVYDEADQITDHGSAQATIHIEIFQTNANLGRSKGTGVITIS